MLTRTGLFFLFVPSVLPHAELQGPDDEFFRAYAGNLIEKPFKGNDYGPAATVPGYASEAQPHATFAGMVSRLDHQVGEILDKLDQLGLTEETIVIFSSDNGSHKEGGADPDFFNSSGGLRGNKRDLYEGGIRVPFIIKWPEKVKPGTTSTHVAAFWDIMPTICGITGAKIPGKTDGISFIDALLGKKKQAVHPYLYWEYHEGGGGQAVRMGNWKGVRLNVLKSQDPAIALYDLEKDPAERMDVAAGHPGIIARMDQYMKQAHQESRLFPFVRK